MVCKSDPQMVPMAMMILTIPIVFPLILDQGFNPIWFGIITVRIFEIAQITPPVGMNVFIIKGVAKDVSLGTVPADIPGQGARGGDWK